MSQVQTRLRNTPADLRAGANSVRRMRRGSAPPPLGRPVHLEGRRVVRHRLSIGVSQTGPEIREILGEVIGQVVGEAVGEVERQARRQASVEGNRRLYVRLRARRSADQVRLTTTGVPRPALTALAALPALTAISSRLLEPTSAPGSPRPRSP